MTTIRIKDTSTVTIRIKQVGPQGINGASGAGYSAVDTFASLPAVGIEGNLYLTRDTDIFYRWDSDLLAYHEISTCPPEATQVQAEDITDVTGTIYGWSLRRLVQFVTAWWATIAPSFLTSRARVYSTVQTSSFTITADMCGKDVIVDGTDVIITLPAWNTTDFGNGFQCKIININATQLTYSGTAIAPGTKQGVSGASVVLTIANGTWIAGGLST